MSNSAHSMPIALQNAMPNLRAFAMTLCGDPHLVKDLVQETLLKAWVNRERFTEGTNLKAWLFTILRNTYVSSLRKSRRELQDVDGAIASNLQVLPEQDGHLDFADFKKALALLSADQREALLLVAAEGFSYEEVSVIAGCAAGTIKSRVNRARARLADLMGLSSVNEIGADSRIRAVLGRALQ